MGLAMVDSDVEASTFDRLLGYLGMSHSIVPNQGGESIDIFTQLVMLRDMLSLWGLRGQAGHYTCYIFLMC